MAIFTVTSNAVENVDIFVDVDFKAGMALMRDDNGRVIKADNSLIFQKTLSQKIGKFLGFATSDHSSAANTIIVPDVIGSSYIDNSYNFIRTENNEVLTTKRALNDNLNESLNKPYNASENMVISRRGLAVYNQPNNIFITDQFVRVLHGDYGLDYTTQIDFNSGDLLTFGSGVNAGKLVKVNVNSIAQEILIVGVVEKFISSTNLLHFKQVTYSYPFSNDSAVMVLDAGNTLSTSKYQYGTICGTAFEGGNLVLTAPNNGIFDKVIFASYGSPSGTCGNFLSGSCHASNSQSIVQGYLLGNNTATIPATNGVFGDPCVGIGKSLYVEARYYYITQAPDLTLKNNNATLNNGVIYSSLPEGSFIFDGTNDYISVPMTTDLNSTSITWSVWYKSASDTNQTLIAKSSTNLDTNFRIAVGSPTITMTNELICVLGIDSGVRFGYISTNRSLLFNNNWHNIVFTAQPSGYKIYLDGIDLPLYFGAGSNTGSVTNNTNILTIGAVQGLPGIIEYVNGRMADIRIYNRALSTTEIQAYYNYTKSRYGL